MEAIVNTFWIDEIDQNISGQTEDTCNSGISVCTREQFNAEYDANLQRYGGLWGDLDLRNATIGEIIAVAEAR